MGDPITSTARGQEQINQDRRVVDMSSKISLLKPSAYPFTAIMSKLAKRNTYNTRFEWLEEDLMSVWVAANATIANNVTTLVLGASQGLQVAVNDLLRVVATDEVIKVTAIAGDSLTISRGYGGSVAAQITAGDKILVMGNALMQGSGSPSEKYTNTRTQFNFTQILKTPYSITNSLKAQKLYGGDEYNRLANRKGIEHGRSIEQMLLFGVRNSDVTGEQPILSTGGILHFMRGTVNDLNVNESLIKLDKLFDIAEQIFTYGNNQKIWFVSPKWQTAIAKIAADYIQKTESEKSLGLRITKLITPHGELGMVQHPLFTDGHASMSMALDIEELEYRPLQDRDTKIEKNIQNNDEDGVRDQYITEVGLEFKQPKKHAIIEMNIGQ